MPLIFQQQINPHTKLGVWRITEPEEFFKAKVPVHRQVSHPHKRLQHLAGRFLLQYLFPGFPHELIEIADTRKPFLPNEKYHFSISHCGNYAAAVVSSRNRVGIDAELISDKPEKLKHKFLTEDEISKLTTHDSRLTTNYQLLTTLSWCCKEAVFKWYGNGEVDFKKHIQLKSITENFVETIFTKDISSSLKINFHFFDEIVLAWVVT